MEIASKKQRTIDLGDDPLLYCDRRRARVNGPPCWTPSRGSGPESRSADMQIQPAALGIGDEAPPGCSSELQDGAATILLRVANRDHATCDRDLHTAAVGIAVAGLTPARGDLDAVA